MRSRKLKETPIILIVLLIFNVYWMLCRWRTQEVAAAMEAKGFSLSLALDVGSWCFAAGRVFDTDVDRQWWPSFLSGVGPNVKVICAGVGNAYGARVQHPADRIHSHALTQHEKWWSVVWSHLCIDTPAATAPHIYIEGATNVGHQRRFAVSNTLSSNVDEINVWLLRRLQQRFDQEINSNQEKTQPVEAPAANYATSGDSIKAKLKSLTAQTNDALNLQVDSEFELEWQSYGIETDPQDDMQEEDLQKYEAVKEFAKADTVRKKAPEPKPIILPGHKFEDVDKKARREYEKYVTEDNDTPKVYIIHRPCIVPIAMPRHATPASVLVLPCIFIHGFTHACSCNLMSCWNIFNGCRVCSSVCTLVQTATGSCCMLPCDSLLTTLYDSLLTTLYDSLLR